MIAVEDIRAICKGRIDIGVPLARFTSYRLGGPVDLYVEPVSADEIVALVKHFQKHSMPYVTLGNGSNVLISDDGFRGAAISLTSSFSDAQLHEGVVEAGAGMRLSTFVDYCIEHSFRGIEMLAGIPGSLGGALIMNAGAYGGAISDHLLSITVLKGSGIRTLKKEECGYRYRGSGLGNDIIILSARFRFPAGEIEELKTVRKEFLLRRNASQPTTMPNAGCMFKNPEGNYAAKLIDECGLKGFRIRGAEVSSIHANFIVRHMEGTSADILEAINHVRKVVYEKTGIVLEPEVRLVGFPSDAIHPLPPPTQEEKKLEPGTDE